MKEIFKKFHFLLLFLVFSFNSYGLQAEYKVDLLTLNVAQLPLPGLLKHIGHDLGLGLNMGNNDKRARKLGNKMRDINPRNVGGPDIVAFQELFDQDSAKTIRDKIKQIYPYYFIDERWGKKGGLGMQSGLAIFSRYPIVQKKLYEYRYRRGIENFARKGMMGVRIALPDGSFINVFTTHLQAGARHDSFWAYFDDKKSEQMTTSELRFREMQEGKENVINPMARPGELVVVMGDFNLGTGKDGDYYRRMLDEVLDLEETFDSGINTSRKGTTWDMKHFENKGRMRTEKNFPIDHIWVSKNEQNPRKNFIEKRSWILGESFVSPNISDHLGLFGRIRYTKR